MNFDLSDEQLAMVEMAAQLASRHAPGPRVSWEQAGTFSWGFMSELAEHGLTGIDVPEERGGQGLSLLDAVLVICAVAEASPHLADAVQAANFGAIRQLAAFGSDCAVDEVLRPALAGRALVTVAMSEPAGGSAVSKLRSRALVDGPAVIVTGSKVFNSGGLHATHYVVWVRFSDEPDGIGAVVVPADTPGFERGAPEQFMSGEVHSTLSFDRCRVPVEYVLLDHDGIRRMMSVFNIERLGNAARSYAYGELALRLATKYMLERETASGRLADFQGLRWKLADMRMKLDAAQLLLYRAATELRDGVPDALRTSVAKCFANETGFEVAHQAMQILGGYGYSMDSPMPYIFARTRGWMIAGGSVEIQRNRIASELLRRHR
jgi:alkylation response protein AidB-like acyl-CoA dehydrogenase